MTDFDFNIRMLPLLVITMYGILIVCDCWPVAALCFLCHVLTIVGYIVIADNFVDWIVAGIWLFLAVRWGLLVIDVGKQKRKLNRLYKLRRTLIQQWERANWLLEVNYKPRCE